MSEAILVAIEAVSYIIVAHHPGGDGQHHDDDRP
jgi:hypothetical protein